MVVPETFLTSGDGIYAYMAGRYGLAFGLSLVLFIAALLVTVIGIVMRLWYRQPIEMLYAALGVLDVACWLLSVSQLTPFVTRIYYVDGVMGFLFCMLMPFAFLIYINSIQKGRYRKCFIVLYCLSLLSFILWTVLHFSGVQSFQSSLVYIDSILGISVIGVFVSLLIDAKKGYIRDYPYTAVGFAAFLILSVFEIIMLIFFELKSNEIPDAVINKPGKLSKDEYETIKKHPVLGAGILENIKVTGSIGEV